MAREGAAWADAELQAFGKLTGSAAMIELGFQANENKPVLYTHDNYGHRIDEVRFHPAYHQLMKTSTENGLHASHWLNPRVGAHVARAAKFYLQSQVEASHGCPITMTAAAVPALLMQPELAAQWLPKITQLGYDPRNIPMEQKSAITVGMAMTEKQGGSDVRANTVLAHALGADEHGQIYELVGHKYFVSAPMSDAFLVLAQTQSGLSCFWVPRWRPDGSKNPMQIQRLKNKMGNVANASCETELRGAWAQRVGEEGRGVATILKMVTMTRFDCMIGSSSGMRQAVAQALHHCNYRSAFGKRLVTQPLMQNVLADLVIEHEAALALTMRIGRALDAADPNEHEKMLVRVGTAVGKYWICKRTPAHAVEAMESYLAEVQSASGADRRLDAYVAQLEATLLNRADIEYRARGIVERMALALQGALLVRHGNSAVADAFCASRLTGLSSGLTFGTLPSGVDCSAIIQRATPLLPEHHFE